VPASSQLKFLQHKLETAYALYLSGEISEEEYLERAKPIDEKIDDLEISNLEGTLLLRGAFSILSQKRES